MTELLSQVCILGLGTMGLPMSTRLLADGYEVRAFDIDKAAEQAFAERGGTIGFSSPADAASTAQFVISSLPNSSHVEEALAGVDGAFSGARPGTYFVDMSTISPTMTRDLGDAASSLGMFFADAPVSGSSEGAIAGTLTIMVGADDEVFAVVERPLQSLGRNIVHVGVVGSGQSIKLLNNLLAAVNMAAVAEAYTLARKAGVDFAVLHQVVSTSTGDSWMLRNRLPAPGVGPEGPADREFAPGFAMRLMCKDLDLVRQFATDSGSTVPLAGLVREMCASAISNGWAELDFSALAKLYGLLAP